MVAVMEVSFYFWAAFSVGGLVTAIMFWREMSPWAKVGSLSGNPSAYIMLAIMTAVTASVWPIMMIIMMMAKAEK